MIVRPYFLLHRWAGATNSAPGSLGTDEHRVVGRVEPETDDELQEAVVGLAGTILLGVAEKLVQHPLGRTGIPVVRRGKTVQPFLLVLGIVHGGDLYPLRDRTVDIVLLSSDECRHVHDLRLRVVSIGLFASMEIKGARFSRSKPSITSMWYS